MRTHWHIARPRTSALSSLIPNRLNPFNNIHTFEYFASNWIHRVHRFDCMYNRFQQKLSNISHTARHGTLIKIRRMGVTCGYVYMDRCQCVESPFLWHNVCACWHAVCMCERACMNLTVTHTYTHTHTYENGMEWHICDGMSAHMCAFTSLYTHVYWRHFKMSEKKYRIVKCKKKKQKRIRIMK